MKRTLEGREVDMANCLMLLSRVGDSSSTDSESSQYSASRVFECKTCNRKFQSFQALGGHRASHKKPRLMGAGDFLNHETSSLLSSPAKPKTHECSICGLEFAIGQALGGHMRRHRAVMSEGIVAAKPLKSVAPAPTPPAVMKKSSSGKRVLSLDLNLTPFENDFLDFKFWKLSSIVA